MRAVGIAAVLAFTATPAFADVRLPPVLGDNMVLQRELAVPVWGTASPGESVTVTFSGQIKRTQADSNGAWRIALDPLVTSATPSGMTIRGQNTIVLKNILVGEVWLTGGQSNMRYAMGGHQGGGDPFGEAKPYVRAVPPRILRERLAADCPELRLFRMSGTQQNPEEAKATGWQACTSENLEAFSAIAFFFGKDLHQALNVPIGMIDTAIGGTQIEPWTPRAAYAQSPVFRAEVAQPDSLLDGQKPGVLYDHMVQPLAPYAVRGFLWYQGEGNARRKDMRYAEKMRLLVASWRKDFGRQDAPFYYVQLSPFLYSASVALSGAQIPPVLRTDLPLFWEQQADALDIANSGMVVTTDMANDIGDIHPDNKWEVGRRLTLLALAKTYAKPGIVYSGPIFRSMRVDAARAVLSFDYAEGIKSGDGRPLNEFTIAGADGKFLPAEAAIQGQEIVVSNPLVTKPSAVRFGWWEGAEPNLVNGAGLPARPFRTDHP